MVKKNFDQKAYTNRRLAKLIDALWAIIGGIQNRCLHGMKLLNLLIGLALLFPAVALADNRLEVIDAWSPEAPPGRMMAGFMELRNHSDEAIVLVDATSPQFGHVEIHTMVMEDGVMRMRRLDQLPIEPGDGVTLEPGGLHLMFIEPLGQMRLGDLIDVELIDEQGRSYPLQAEVRARHRPAMGH